MAEKKYNIKEHKGKVVISSKIGVGLNNFSFQLAMDDNRKDAMMMAIKVIGEAIRRFSAVGKEIAEDLEK
jgi:hypothetical protein